MKSNAFSFFQYFVASVATALVYFIAGKLGLSLAYATKQVTALWPATGIAVVALLLYGKRIWPAIYLGAFLLNLTSDETVATAAGIAVGNVLGPLATVFMLTRFVRFEFAPARVRDVVGLCVCSSLGMTLSATNGVTNLALSGIVSWSSYADVWFVWWIGDTMGAVILAPMILSWNASKNAGLSREQRMEFLSLLALLFGVATLVFTSIVVDNSMLHHLEYAVFPIIIWGALRFGQREMTTIVALIVAVAIWGVSNGGGPFVTGDLDQDLTLLGLFMAAVAVTGLILSSVTHERRAYRLALLESHANLEARVAERTRELEVANRAKSEFLASMDHELRTPINGVLGMVDALLREQLTSRQARLALVLKSSSEILLMHMNDIFNLSKIESGRVELEKRKSSLAEAARIADTPNLPAAAAKVSGSTPGELGIVDNADGDMARSSLPQPSDPARA